MKIRMKTGIAGMFHDNPNGVRVGDEVDINEADALRYIENGYAEAVTKRDARKADKAAAVELEEGLAVVDSSAPVERAVNAEALDPEVVIHDENPSVPAPLDEPDLDLVAQEDNPKPVKHSLAGPEDDPEFVDDEAAKGVITDPDEVEEILTEDDAEPVQGRPRRGNNRGRRR